MKKIVCLMLLTIVCETSMAQIEWRLLGNPAVAAGDYVGSQGLANLNFRTNANPRMRIFNGASGLTGNGATTDGFVGIGDFNFFAPLNLLHQHLNYNRSNFHQFTNLNTENTATEGSLFGIEYRSATNPILNYVLATIRQRENAPIYFYTADSLRMVINENRSAIK